MMISEIQSEGPEVQGYQPYQPYQPSYDMGVEQYDDYGPVAPMVDDQSAISESLMNPVDSVDGIQFDSFGADAPFGSGPAFNSWGQGDGGGMGMDTGERYDDGGFDLPM